MGINHDMLEPQVFALIHVKYDSVLTLICV
jgi:hypothetical protein